MISKETCVKIWNCWNEIDSAKKLIEGMAEAIKEDKEKRPPTIHNAFGERCGLELGVPVGRDGHRIYGVNTSLGIKIIEQHISDQERRLDELMAIAKIELSAEYNKTEIKKA